MESCNPGDGLAEQTDWPSVSVAHEIFVMLPGPGRGFKALDKHDSTVAAMLDQIAGHYQVYITVADPTKFKLVTKNMIVGRDAVNAIFDYLKIKPAEVEPVGAYVLLAPPSMGPDLFEARLLSSPDYDGWRPTYVIGDSRPGRSSFPTENEMNLKIIAANYRSFFQQYLAQIGRSIGTIEKKVRMRIELGTFRMSRRPSGLETCGYNDLARQAAKAGRQGTGRVDERIPFKVVMRMLRKIHLNTEDFEPTSAGYTNSVKPWYELILFAGKYRLESRLKIKTAGGERSHHRSGIGSAGTVESFHAYHRDISQHVLEIATLCPEQKHDWRLLVSGEADQQEALPINNLLISRQLSLGQFNDLDLGSYLKAVDTTKGGVMAVRVFPRIRLSENFGTVARVIGKTTWVFGIVGTDYRVEISLFHIWSRDERGQLSTDTKPHISGGVSLYCREWDDELGIERDVLTHPREYDDFLEVMFPCVEAAGTEDRLEGLLHCVKLVQNVLDAASTEIEA